MTTLFKNIPNNGSPTWKEPVADFASLPSSGNTAGDTRVTLDTSAIYVWDSVGLTWNSGGGGSGLTSLNGLIASTQTFATGTTGTNFGIVSSGSAHTFNLPIASATNTGKLSSTDWSTFNSKVSGFPILAPGGSVSSPSYAFSETGNDTGIYSQGDGNLSFANNATLTLQIDPTEINAYVDFTTTGNIAAANYPPTSTANTFAGFGNSGNFESIPGWTFSNTTKGLSSVQIYAPAAPANFNYNQFVTSVEQTADIDTSNLIQLVSQVSLDPLNSGFKSGSATGIYTEVTHRASSQSDGKTGNQVEIILGDTGLTGGSSTSVSLSLNSVTSYDTYSVDNFYGVTSQGSFSNDTSVGNYIGFYLSTGVHKGLSSIVGLSLVPQVDSAAIATFFGVQNSPTIGSVSATSISSYISYLHGPSFANGTTVTNYSVLDDGASTGSGSIALGGYSGINLHPYLNATGVSNINMFVDGTNLGNDSATDISSYSTFSAYTSFRSNVSLNSYVGLSIAPTFYTGSSVSNSILGVNITPFVDTTGLDYMYGLSIGANIGQNSATAIPSFNEIGASTQFHSNAAITNYTGLSITPSFQSGATVSNYKGITVSPAMNGQVLNEATGIYVDMSQISLDPANNNLKVGISTNDALLQVSGQVSTSGFSTFPSTLIANNIGTQFTVNAGSPLTGQFGFLNFLGSNVIFEDDVAADFFLGSLGFSMNGFVGQVVGATGKTMDTLNFMMAGASVPDVGQGAGGTLTNAVFFAALGLLPAGGNLAVTNMYGFKVGSSFTAMSPTNAWGFYCEDPNANNYFKKNVIVGTNTTPFGTEQLTVAGKQYVYQLVADSLNEDPAIKIDKAITNTANVTGQYGAGIATSVLVSDAFNHTNSFYLGSVGQVVYQSTEGATAICGGVQGSVDYNSTGTLFAGIGVSANVVNSNATGVIAGAVGFLSEIANDGGGGITTGYNFRVDANAATDAWGFYCDSDIKHFLGGETRFGGTNDAAPLAKIDTSGNAEVNSIKVGTDPAQNNLNSGTYTPTLTNVANLDAITAYKCQWIRVGNIVTVSGKLDADPTAAASTTQVGISLPIASNIGASEDCSGTAFSPSIAGQGAAIIGDATNNRAQMEWISVDITNQPMYFTFTYEII